MRMTKVGQIFEEEKLAAVAAAYEKGREEGREEERKLAAKKRKRTAKKHKLATKKRKLAAKKAEQATRKSEQARKKSERVIKKINQELMRKMLQIAKDALQDGVNLETLIRLTKLPRPMIEQLQIYEEEKLAAVATAREEERKLIALFLLQNGEELETIVQKKAPYFLT